jgi:hypothetical protein
VTLSTGSTEKLWLSVDEIVTCQWSPKGAGIAAIGCSKGHVLIMDVFSRQTLHEVAPANEIDIVELRWNPGGENIIL